MKIKLKSLNSTIIKCYPLKRLTTKHHSSNCKFLSHIKCPQSSRHLSVPLYYLRNKRSPEEITKQNVTH